MQGLAAFFMLAVFFAVVVVSLTYTRNRSGDVIAAWAREHELTVVSSEYRHLFKGPFFFTSGRSQRVYFVTVRDKQGRTRSAYVRCGASSPGCCQTPWRSNGWINGRRGVGVGSAGTCTAGAMGMHNQAFRGLRPGRWGTRRGRHS
jgi:hypothetical protein